MSSFCDTQILDSGEHETRNKQQQSNLLSSCVCTCFSLSKVNARKLFTFFGVSFFCSCYSIWFHFSAIIIELMHTIECVTVQYRFNSLKNSLVIRCWLCVCVRALQSFQKYGRTQMSDYKCEYIHWYEYVFVLNYQF